MSINNEAVVTSKEPLIKSIDSKERIVNFKNGEHCFASVRNVKKI
jgi:hypothetical protein